MALSDLVVNITGNAQGFNKTLGGVTSGVRGFGSIAGKVTLGLKASFAGLAASLAPLLAAFKGFQFLGESADLAKTQIAAEKKLGAVLKATGNAAGLTADEIKNLASQRQALTNFGDEDTINASALLASFKEIKGDEFRRAIPLIQDMSAAMGQDLKGSAIQLGKAINDPIAGIGALSRVGVQFTYDQKQMIKGLVETGQMAKAQAVIMNELQSEFGGTAEAMASPLTQAANAWGDFKEQIGMIWNDIKVAALEAFGFDEAMAASGNMAADFRQKWLPTIKGVITSVGNLFKSVVGFMKEQWNSWIGDTVKEIFFITENFELFTQIGWEMFKLFLSNSWEGFKTFFVNVNEAMGWLGDNWPALLKDMASFLLATTKNMAANMGSFFKGVMDFAKGKGFKPKFKSLTEGWESSLKDLPKFTKANVQESTRELDRLFGEEAKRRLEFEKRFAPLGEMPTGPKLPIQQNDAASGVKREDFVVNTSIEAGTKEAFSKIFSAISGNEKKKPEKETADNTKDTVLALGELKRLWEKLEKKLTKKEIVEFIG